MKRSFDDIKHFNSSDYRDFTYYSGVACLSLGLKAKYFQHFLLLVTAIRLLTSETLNEKDKKNSFYLLNKFVQKFKTLYGLEHMVFNLHGHTHLAVQATRYGPLHKSTCFAFEGMFKISKESIHGTRNYINQVHEYLSIDRLIDFELEDLFKNSSDNRFVTYLHMNIKPCNEKINGKATKLADNNVDLYIKRSLKLNDDSILVEIKRLKNKNYSKFN